MAEYIEREAAIEAVKHAWAKGLEPTQYIEVAPAADVEPVQETLKRVLTEIDRRPSLDAIKKEAIEKMEVHRTCFWCSVAFKLCGAMLMLEKVIEVVKEMKDGGREDG